MHIKKCKGPCGLDLEENLDNFYFRPGRQVWLAVCRICMKLKTKRNYENNKEKIKKKSSDYRKNNPEKAKAAKQNSVNKNNEYYLNLSRNYSKNNRDIINKRKRDKYHNDPIYKLRHSVSSIILGQLKNKFSSKNGESITKYLPYTIEELQKHIESLWEPWMNWNNHGIYKSGGERKWHIDHIIPQASLPYTSMKDENFQKCWALPNLRPLEAVANIKKRNKIL